jgi:hypothetical protein
MNTGGDRSIFKQMLLGVVTPKPLPRVIDRQIVAVCTLKSHKLRMSPDGN